MGWGGAFFALVVATLFYNPGLVESGKLLVWIDGAFYTIAPDGTQKTLIVETGQSVRFEASPGCYGLVRAPCWLQFGRFLTRLPGETIPLPLEPADIWINPAVSWSPDGTHLAYTIANTALNRTELRIFNVITQKSQTLAADVEASTRPVWSHACARAFEAPQCRLAFRKLSPKGDSLAEVVALVPTRGLSQTWTIPGGFVPILGWTADDRLIYSNEAYSIARAIYVSDESPVLDMPTGVQYPTNSPEADYAVYYQVFRAEGLGCRLTNLLRRGPGPDACQRRGIWISDRQGQHPRLVYSTEATSRRGGFNSDPIWSPAGDAFLIFHEGQAIYHDLATRQTEVWYQDVPYGPRTDPVFSPDRRAIAMIVGDQAGAEQIDDRLLILGHRLKPMSVDLEVKRGVRLIAWLPPATDLYLR